MTTSSTTHHTYGEYISPTADASASPRENPLVLMAQACNNIGKELTIPAKQRSPPPVYPFKAQKSSSPPERRKSLKRSAPSTSTTPSPKRLLTPPVASASLLDSLVLHHLNQVVSSSLLPSFPPSNYLIDSILSSSPFVCNWMNATIDAGLCGKRFQHPTHLLEHLCAEHTSFHSAYPFYSSPIDRFE